MKTFTHISHATTNINEPWPPARAKPLLYFVEPSSLCNAACIFCHYPQLRDAGKHTDNASDKTIDKSIEILQLDAKHRDLNNIGVSLTPTTGDILINKNWFNYAKTLLNQPFVGWLDIVTNGILLNSVNIEKLAQLTPIEKLDFSISVGGLDKETYAFMFGTDMFNKVQRNIQNLFDYLINNNIKLNVTIRLRVPDAAKISDNDIINTFNPKGYIWASYEVLDTFKDVPLNVPGKTELKTTAEIQPRKFNPCGMLKTGSLNFNANGSITACGCHYSQIPNEKSLQLGTVDTPLEEITKKRKRLLRKWKYLNSIPKPCLTCQHFHQHDGALQNKILLRGIYDANHKEIFQLVRNKLKEITN